MRYYKQYGERDLSIQADLRGCGRSAEIKPPNDGVRFSSIAKATILLVADGRRKVSAVGEANVDIEDN